MVLMRSKAFYILQQYTISTSSSQPRLTPFEKLPLPRRRPMATPRPPANPLTVSSFSPAIPENNRPNTDSSVYIIIKLEAFLRRNCYPIAGSRCLSRATPASVPALKWTRANLIYRLLMQIIIHIHTYTFSLPSRRPLARAAPARNAARRLHCL